MGMCWLVVDLDRASCSRFASMKSPGLQKAAGGSPRGSARDGPPCSPFVRAWHLAVQPLRRVMTVKHGRASASSTMPIRTSGRTSKSVDPILR